MISRERRARLVRRIAPAALVQFALAGYAWWDLARRPRELVRGSKPAWAAIIAVNFVGPIAYLWIGRLRPPGGAGERAERGFADSGVGEATPPTAG